MGALQKLTNDKVVYSTQKDGSFRVRIASVGNGKKYMGTRLIRRVNSSEKIMTLNVKRGENERNRESDVNLANAINGIGTDVSITINPDREGNIPTLDPKTNRAKETTRPLQIGLAHEMIHGDRSMRGAALDYDQKIQHTYINSEGNKKTKNIKVEEAATIGLSHVRKDDITENDIRKEQGLSPRVGY